MGDCFLFSIAQYPGEKCIGRSAGKSTGTGKTWTIEQGGTSYVLYQDQDIFRSQAENQVSPCEEGYRAQSSPALLARQHEVSPRAKSILTPAAQVLLNFIKRSEGCQDSFRKRGNWQRLKCPPHCLWWGRKQVYPLQGKPFLFTMKKKIL